MSKLLQALAVALAVTPNVPNLKCQIPYHLPDSKTRNTGAAKQRRAAKRRKK